MGMNITQLPPKGPKRSIRAPTQRTYRHPRRGVRTGRIEAFVTPELALRIRMAATVRGTTIGALITEAIEAHLSGVGATQ